MSTPCVPDFSLVDVIAASAIEARVNHDLPAWVIDFTNDIGMDELVVVGDHILRHKDAVFIALSTHDIIVPDLIRIGTRLERLLADLVGSAVFQINIASIGHIALLGLGGIGSVDHLYVG